MADRHERAPASDPLRFPDGRPKASPDETSLLGLAAVWSELDEPLPPKNAGRRRGVRGRRSGRRARRIRRQRVAPPVVLGLVGAVVLTLGVIGLLIALLT